MDRLNCTQMKDGNKETYEFLNAHGIELTTGAADRLLRALEHLDEGLSGYEITRKEHSLRFATRAWRNVFARTPRDPVHMQAPGYPLTVSNVADERAAT